MSGFYDQFRGALGRQPTALLTPDPVRFELLDHSGSEDRLLDISPAAARFLEQYITASLPAGPPPVRKLVYRDLTIFFIWGPAETLARYLGESVRVSAKYRAGIHIWILGAREATTAEQEAQHWNIWRS